MLARLPRVAAVAAAAAATVAVAVVAGCGDDLDDYPIVPGGPVGPGFAMPPGPGPGGPDGGADLTVVAGRVCRTLDLLDLSACAPIGVGGMTVAINGVSTLTAPDGTFELAMPSASLMSFVVSGPGAITTTTPFSPSTTLRVIDADVFARALASNNIDLPLGTGAILGNIVRAGLPAAGFSVQSAPLSVFGPLFDDVTGFGFDRTGARGIFLVPGVTGPANLVFSPGESLVAGIPVINGGVTLLDSIVMP